MTLLKPPSLVLIDAAVKDHQQLALSVGADCEVVVLSPDQNGIDQITQVLATYPDIESLHIVSHGQPGGLLLGGTIVDSRSLAAHAAAIRGWARTLKHRASILLYGCQVAATEAGRDFVQQLQALTGSEIAASTTLTGSAAAGGNWQLDFTTGLLSRLKAGLTPFSAAALAAYPHTLTVLLNETFTGNTVAGTWQFGAGVGSANPFLTASTNTTAPAGGLPGSGPTPIDPAGAGVLRLTNNTNNQAAYVIYDTPFASNAGISVEFDFFSYNGTTGGDGISFFLIDGTTPTVTSGAFGGSLGYAQKIQDGITGIEGGYVGIGLDEFGNFSARTDNPGGPDQRVGPPAPAGDAAVPDSVSLRGRVGATGLAGYNFLGGSGTLPSSIDNAAATTRTAATRRARLDITRAGLLSVRIDLNGDGDFLDLGEAPSTLSNINIVTANGGTVPATFKFGLASSTGNATNIHEVRNLTITTFSTPPTVANATVGVPPSSTVNVTGLAATDAETSIASYTILTLPTAAQGTLFLGNPQAGGTPVTAGQVLTPAQVSQLFFRSVAGFSGSSFTYTATDTDTDVAQPPGTITLTRIEINTPNPSPGPSPTPGPSPSPSPGTPDVCAPGRNRRTSNEDSRLIGGANSDRLRGRDGNDVIEGRGCNDLIRAGRGNDVLRGNAASDNLLGQQNDDRLYAAGANDQANGGLGRDRINLGRGNDTARGGRGNDILNGGRGIDRLDGNDSNDRVSGNEGNDSLNGARGNDRIDGGAGDDSLNGGLQRDRLLGRAGIDTLFGRRGNDRLRGGSQADILSGGLNADFLIGGGGADTLSGGSGGDRFVYRNVRHGRDNILGFERSDQFDLRDIFAKGGYTRTPRFERYVRLAQVGSDTVVRVDGNGNAAGGFVALATVINVNASSLNSSNFLV